MGVEWCAKAILVPLMLTLAGDQPPSSASGFVARGMQRFRDNQVADSLEDFDRAAKLEPRLAPHLWQRGISDYYAGKFVEGRKQFELHKEVNPHDVENATWHFICVARKEGIESARKLLIKIDTRRDSRVPMSQVYELYAGRGSEKAVLDAAERAGTETARMYANLYLGLYYEVAGKESRARDFMLKAAAASLRDNYMHNVAKIHLLQRQWKH